MVRAGRLRHRGTIQAPSTATNEYGETEDRWVDVAERWMGVEPITGREFLNGQQVQAEVSHRILMRGGDTVTPKNRIRLAGRIFNIEAVNDVREIGAELELLCREVVV